jgi:hypothetical protein
MAIDRGIIDRIRERGEEVLTQVSAGLTSNPRIAKAVEGAMRGKERLEEGVGRVLRQMNVPSRSELKRALSRIESLEREVAELKARARAGTRAAGGRRPARGKAKPKPAAG